MWDDELEGLHLRAMAQCANATTPEQRAALRAMLSDAALARSRRQQQRRSRRTHYAGSGKFNVYISSTAEDHSSW